MTQLALRTISYNLRVLLIGTVLLTGIALVACADDDASQRTNSLISEKSVVSSSSNLGNKTKKTAHDTTILNISAQDPTGTGDYKFVDNEFFFKVGEKVEFNITAQNELHTFTVEDLGIDLLIDAGDTETLTFTFDKSGEYQLVCTPHETLGMVGTIIVE